jgi:hypothetical protein
MELTKKRARLGNYFSLSAGYIPSNAGFRGCQDR